MPSFKDYQAYAQALQCHDWTYDFSDDHRVWKAGQAAEKKLRLQASTDTLYMHAFTCWADFMRTEQSIKDCTQRDARIELVGAALSCTEKETA